jgi:glutathione peroxidase
MRTLTLLAAASLFLLSPAFAQSEGQAEAPVYRHTLTDIDGQQVSLDRFRGKVLLIVNTASQCGFTRQYKALEALFKRYESRGLVVLGMPCNDFGGQEPGTEEEIKLFCQERYGVTFPMFAKLEVRGDDQAPLYRDLTARAGKVSWNFTKFLISRSGEVVQQFSSGTDPLDEDLVSKLEAALEDVAGEQAPAPSAE